MNLIKWEISQISKSLKNEILYFIEKNNGTIFHEPEFNTILSNNYGSQLFYFLLYNNSEIIAICPLHKIKRKYLTIWKSNFLEYSIPYGGWVYNSNFKDDIRLRNLIKISPFESIDYSSSILNSFYTKKSKESIYYTSLINLKDHSLEEIKYKYVSKNTRHNITRSIRNQIKIQQDYSLDTFLSLNDELKVITGVGIPNINFFCEVYDYYKNQNKAFILISFHNEIPISSLFIIGNSNYQHAWIAGRKQNIEKNLYQNELLWWEAITLAKCKSVKYFDLCYIYSQLQLEQNDIKQMRIAAFKMGFSKELVPFYCISKKSFIFRVINKLQNVFNI